MDINAYSEISEEELIARVKNGEKIALAPNARRVLSEQYLKEFYIKTFPTDELGQDLDEKATFENLWDCLNDGTDVYECFGAGDSIVRERMFSKLSKMLNISYDVIYEMWLR